MKAGAGMGEDELKELLDAVAPIEWEDGDLDEE